MDKFNLKKYLAEGRLLKEAEIDYEKEKTWRIQDKFPIEVTVKKGWSGNYYTIEPKPMDISYDAFIDLGSDGNVGYTSYNYTTGKARWTSDSLEQIKQWEEDNQDKIKVIYPNNSLNEGKKSVDLKAVASYFGMSWFDFSSKSNSKRKEFVELYKKQHPVNKNQKITTNVYYVDEYQDFYHEAVPEYEIDDVKAMLSSNGKNHLYIKKGTKGQYEDGIFTTEEESDTRVEPEYIGEGEELNEFEEIDEGKNKDKKRIRSILNDYSTNAYSTLRTEKGLYIPEDSIQKMANEIGEYLSSTDVQGIKNLLQSYVNNGGYATGNYISGDDMVKISNEIVNNN